MFELLQASLCLSSRLRVCLGWPQSSKLISLVQKGAYQGHGSGAGEQGANLGMQWSVLGRMSTGYGDPCFRKHWSLGFWKSLQQTSEHLMIPECICETYWDQDAFENVEKTRTRSFQKTNKVHVTTNPDDRHCRAVVWGLKLWEML